MDPEELRERLWPILHPEPDEDSGPGGSPPHKRLFEVHGLDCSYWSPYESSSTSIWNRLIRDARDPLHDSIQSLTVPGSLSVAAIRLFGESLIAYADQEDQFVKQGWGVFRYYPSVLITFWSAFEAFVRLQSEYLLAMKSSLPHPIRLALSEEEEYVDDRGRIRTRNRRRPVLDRYALLLQHGYSLEVDRGAQFWQNGVRAVEARDALAHYHVRGAPSITCRDLWTYLEAIALLWIAPSAHVGRSIYWQQYDCYEMLAKLHPFLQEFEERPLHKDWPRGGGILVYAPFDGVDDERYPRGGTMDPSSFSLKRFRDSRDDPKQ